MEWRDTYIYPQQYEVSSNGDIRNKHSKKILKQQTVNGYKVVRLSLHDKKMTLKVHRAVAMAFIENPMSKPQVNHIDGNKYNNNVDNLEWCTNGENQKHACLLGMS